MQTGRRPAIAVAALVALIALLVLAATGRLPSASSLPVLQDGPDASWLGHRDPDPHMLGHTALNTARFRVTLPPEAADTVVPVRMFTPGSAAVFLDGQLVYATHRSPSDADERDVSAWRREHAFTLPLPGGRPHAIEVSVASYSGYPMFLLSGLPGQQTWQGSGSGADWQPAGLAKVNRAYSEFARALGARWLRLGQGQLGGFRMDGTTIWLKALLRVAGPEEAIAFDVACLGSCRAWLDGGEIGTSDSPASRSGVRMVLPPLPAGDHELLLRVENPAGLPAARVPRVGRQGLREWLSSSDGEHWQPAWSLAERRYPVTASLLPSTTSAVAMLAPFLAVWAVLVVLAARGAWRLPGMRGLLEPHAFHLLLIAAWLCIGLHNAVRLPLEYGFDAEQHLDYIRFIVANRALPLASDGWQMFQSPLYYLLSAAFVDALQPWLDEGSVYRALRLLPVLFGALHIEVVYRCVRLCFPGESSLIRLSTAVGGFLPVSLYMSQGLGNETLAGLLTGTLILLCLRMILRADPGRFLRSAFLIGVAWGLAMLAKLTPALMAPAIAYALLQGARAERSSRAVLVSALLLVATTAALVCGWYYLRNVEAFGTPFVGGWDPERGLLWFQPPGYRYAVDLVTFGRALVWPVYSGAVGFLDGVYSTMWLDGMLGGRIYPDRATLEAALPWHPVPLVAGSLTALLPAVLMLRGAAVIAVSSSPALRLAGVCLLTYWLALAWMFLAVPNYAIAKASYTLGLLPCYALLFAAGARKWLDHPAMSRAIPAWIACWWLVACLATLSR